MFDLWRTGNTYADAVAVRLLPAAAWQRRQAQRLDALLHEVSQRSAWWRSRLAPARQPDGSFDMQRVPVSHKRRLMQGFADWVTDPALELAALRRFAHGAVDRADAFDDRFMVWETSGSSGEPALFVQDAAAMAVIDAVEAARGPASLLEPGAMQRALRLAFVGAIDGPFASIVSLQRLRRLNPWLARHSRAFSFLQPVPSLVVELQDWRPQVLSTYPSIAWLLAQEQHAGRLDLELEAVWTGGETLTPAVRREVAHAFGCPVVNSYGASECLTIAFDCAAGSLHLNADWVLLEPMDDRGRPVAPGATGSTTLLTNLANTVQPIIRYDLGDQVRIVDVACPCGCPLPTLDVHGRSDDVLTLQGSTGGPVHLTPLALTTVFEDEAGVFDFCLRQRGPKTLTLELYGSARQRRSVATAALQRLLQLHGAVGTTVQVRCMAEPTLRSRSGKQPRIVRDARGRRRGPTTIAASTR